MTKVQVQTRSPVVRAGLETVLRESSAIEVTENIAEADVVIADGDMAPHEGAPVILLSDDGAGQLRSGIRGLLPRTASEFEIAAAV